MPHPPSQFNTIGPSLSTRQELNQRIDFDHRTQFIPVIHFYCFFIQNEIPLMSMFQPNEMRPENFLTYDQKIGKLFNAIPWFIIIPFCAVVTYVVTYGLLLPAIEKRQWVPPTKDQLNWKYGFIIQNRINSQSPYTFYTNDKKIFIYCNPDGFAQNCLGSVGIYGRAPSKTPIRIAIFDVHKDAGTIHVIAAADADNVPILPFREQHAALSTAARIEDNSKRLPIFRLGLAIFMYLYMLIGLISKLYHSMSKKTKER